MRTSKNNFQCVYQESHYKGAVLKVISKLLLLSMHVRHDQKVKCASFPSPFNLNAWHWWSNWKKMEKNSDLDLCVKHKQQNKDFSQTHHCCMWWIHLWPLDSSMHCSTLQHVPTKSKSDMYMKKKLSNIIKKAPIIS